MVVPEKMICLASPRRSAHLRVHRPEQLFQDYQSQLSKLLWQSRQQKARFGAIDKSCNHTQEVEASQIITTATRDPMSTKDWWAPPPISRGLRIYSTPIRPGSESAMKSWKRTNWLHNWFTKDVSIINTIFYIYLNLFL